MKTMTEPLDDWIYIQRVSQGDQEAFRELVGRYQGLVYRIAYSMCGNAETSKDAVQEVFFRSYRAIHTYQPQWSFKTWLRRITVNYLLDLRKKRCLQTVSMTTEDGDMMEIDDSTYDPTEMHFQNEREEVVLNAVNRLPDPFRTVIMLRHFEQLSYEEIADTLDMPLGTVMTQLHRARKKLSENLRPIQSELMS